MFSCSYEECGATFKKRWRLVEHLVKHTGEKPFVCTDDGCDKRFSRKSHLQRHMKSHSTSKNLECQEEGCKMKFVANESLKRHVKRVHQERPFQCTWQDCGKVFKKHQQLKYHTCQHSGNLPHVCDYEGCEKAFSVPSKLKAHKKTHEGYTCDVLGCGVIVFKWSLMRKHKAEIHNRNFPCENCGKLFKTNSKLKSHSKIHDSQREVYECPYQECKRSYTRVLYLQQHVNNYHQGARPFACSYEGCVKTFANRVSLLKHKVVHEPGYCKPPSNPKRQRSLASRLSGFPDGTTRRRDVPHFAASRKLPEKQLIDIDPVLELDNICENDFGKNLTRSGNENKILSHDLDQTKITWDPVEDDISITSNLKDIHERSSECCSINFQNRDVVLEKRLEVENIAVEHRDTWSIHQHPSCNETGPVRVIAELNVDRKDVWTVISEKVVNLFQKSVILGQEINCNSILSVESNCLEETCGKDVNCVSKLSIMQREATSVNHSDDSSVNKSMEEVLVTRNDDRVHLEYDSTKAVNENMTTVKKLLDAGGDGDEESDKFLRGSAVGMSC